MASAAKLKVEELRSQLSLRGLDASGTKPLLVKRLEGALQKEEEEKAKAVGVGKKRKRPREDDEEDGGDEQLRKMSVRELRERAAREGIDVGGLKKAEILERLREKGADDADGGETKVEGEKKEKLVTTTKKGGAVLDQWLPEHVKAHYHVLQLGEDAYSAILNQTNVGNNNNKFYIIQALESDIGANYMVYYRWGRVGVRGQDKLQGPYMSEDVAIGEFQSKFFDKTKNLWHERKDFVRHPKCYTLLEMDYNETEKETVCKPEKFLSGTQHRDTKLQPSLAQFISLVCNISMMKQQMLEIGYNAEKLPLGKLSKATILKGYDVLKRISAVIGQTDRKQLEQLSSEFYTVIPHDFGFKKMCEFVIDTPQKLKSKLEMVEALGEIEIATNILRDETVEMDDPLYSQYQCLQCELTPVEVDSKEFMMIKKYMLNTHAKTHSGYLVDIVQIFRASRKGESERFQNYSKTKNRMLLWHGSRLTNWTGILSQGLRIAPPEAPVTGYMFGKGVYFADMFSKSANYCYASKRCASGVLLLCEVALGDMAELLAANYYADQLPEGKLSTKGVGATVPDPKMSETLEDGVAVPLGIPKEQSRSKGSLLYNEYIVYNVDQIRMRYVIQVKFNFKY